jgi:hypothetical protein
MTYDTSNNSFYCYYAEVVDGEGKPTVQPYAFQTLGKALNFFQPHIMGEWKNDDGTWWAYIGKSDVFKVTDHMVLIKTLVVIK